MNTKREYFLRFLTTFLLIIKCVCFRYTIDSSIVFHADIVSDIILAKNSASKEKIIVQVDPMKLLLKIPYNLIKSYQKRAQTYKCLMTKVFYCTSLCNTLILPWRKPNAWGIWFAWGLEVNIKCVIPHFLVLPNPTPDCCQFPLKPLPSLWWIFCCTLVMCL